MADAVIQAKLISSGVVPGGGAWEVWQVFNGELVNATATVDSVVHTAGATYGFDLTQFRYFGLYVLAASATGTADLTVQLLQSYNDTAANYVVPDTAGTVDSALAETAMVYALAPSPMPRARLRLVGNAGNPVDTLVSAWLFMQA